MQSNITSWVSIPEHSDFSIHNIPFGIFSTQETDKRIGTAIGDHVLDLSGVAALGHFESIGISNNVFSRGTLNEFISLGKEKTNAVRKRVQYLLSESDELKAHPSLLLSQSEVTMHMPVSVGDYTDFYSSIEHATNVGKMFRDPENALLPNWRHLPVGYHGRASSIIESGINIHRPKGQTKPADGPPIYGPSQRMDFELEMAFIIGKDTSLGDSISTREAEDYIFGMTLFNDWSARDIQKWEYVPLGPFLGKSFASSTSPWVVTLEALDFLRTSGPVQEPEVLPYLTYKGVKNFDIKLEVSLQPQDGEENIISNSNFKYMYWNMSQQLAHHTVNGCNVRVGDMMASGTISGKTPEAYGSMLEIAWAGKNPLTLSDGTERKFIHDYDTVTMRGFGEKEGIRVGFGEVKAQILPAK